MERKGICNPLLHLPFVPLKTRAQAVLSSSHTRKHLCQKCQPPSLSRKPFSLHQPPNLTWCTMTAVIRVSREQKVARCSPFLCRKAQFRAERKYIYTRNPQWRLRRLATARPAGGSRSLRSLGWLASLAKGFHLKSKLDLGHDKLGSLCSQKELV